MLDSGPIDLAVWVDGALAASSTTFTRSGTGMLCVRTIVPGPEGAELGLQSVYAGAPGLATRSVHVLAAAQLQRSTVDEHHDEGPEAS